MPAAVVTASRLCCLSTLVSTTVAPGSTPPDVSLTTPLTAPPDCAAAMPAQAVTHTVVTSTASVRLIASPFSNLCGTMMAAVANLRRQVVRPPIVALENHFRQKLPARLPAIEPVAHRACDALIFAQHTGGKIARGGKRRQGEPLEELAFSPADPSCVSAAALLRAARYNRSFGESSNFVSGFISDSTREQPSTPSTRS